MEAAAVFQNIDSLHLVWGVLLHIATVLGVLLASLLVSQVLRSPRMPAATMGWLFVIIFIPLIGIPLYLTFGERKLNAKMCRKAKIHLPDTPDIHDHPMHSLLVSLGIPSSCSGNRVQFHENGSVAYQSLLALLEGAQRTIDIAIFILGDDLIGQEILAVLEDKATQGVKVRLLLDGVGSFKLPKKILQPLVDQGGRIAWFIPIMHRPLRGRTNLRNHRKMIIADNEKVWAGGRNFARQYLGKNCADTCWIDLSFSQQGAVVSTYSAIFEADWRFATNSSAEDRICHSRITVSGQSRVQVIPSGPDVADDPIYATILTACYVARQRLLIVTPYYVPDAGVQEALKLAALRGVVVELILPAKSNHYLADIARNRYLRELDKAGVRIWFLPDVMLHAKVLVVDTTFAMAGSANLDIRSLFLNYEIMSAFYSESDVTWLTHWLESLRQRCERHYPRSAGVFREIFEGLILLGAYQL